MIESLKIAASNVPNATTGRIIYFVDLDGTLKTKDSSGTVVAIGSGGSGGAGTNGWSPVFAIVVDGSREVMQVVDWTNGTGTKPTTGLYIGPTGLVSAIGSAVNIKGSTGPTGATGPQGNPATNLLTSVAGRTGDVTLTKADVSLGNVDNTSDANKPTTAAVTSALAAKADASAMTTALGLKADTATVNTALAAKADTTTVNTALAAKADTTTVNTALAAKQNTLTSANAGTGIAISAGVISATGGGGGSSFTQTTSETAPTTPNLGDEWYQPSTDILFKRINDGASALWLDISTIINASVTSVAGRQGAVTLTSTDVGLGNVTNTSDANKPVSTAQAAAIAAINKTSVGLGNVDNTSDATKPVSTATQTALDLKQNINSSTTAIAASRSLTNADSGKTFDCAAVTITVPTGLVSGFSVVLLAPDTGTLTIASSGGVLLNGATTSLTRTNASNPAGVAIIPRATADSYKVSGAA